MEATLEVAETLVVKSVERNRTQSHRDLCRVPSTSLVLGCHSLGNRTLYSTVLGTELCLMGFGNERINEQMTLGEV